MPGPICEETRKPLSFKFGGDGFFYCGVSIPSAKHLARISDIVSQKAAWQCRVPIVPDRTLYLPLTIPLWGVAEDSHAHVNQHLHFVFHSGGNGQIVGASAYSVYDQEFKLLAVGSVLDLHGPTRWFVKTSFVGMNSQTAAPRQQDDNGVFPIVLWCIVTAMVVIIGSALMYQRILKPRLVAKFQRHKAE